MTWKEVGRAGVFGDKTQERIQELDLTYGVGNWKIQHKFKQQLLDFEQTCTLFEEAYYLDSFHRELLWKSLQRTAKDVYDISLEDIKSKTNYLIQNSGATHIQDIAIRNVFLRRNWNFMGEEYIQIRSVVQPYGAKLSPGRVPFHLPGYIHEPALEGWWDVNSVEDFYQSNKFLYVRKQ